MLDTQKINAAWIAKTNAKVAARRTKDAADAALFEVGQKVKDRRGNVGFVVSVSEMSHGKEPIVTVDFNGNVKGFQPCFLTAI